MEKSTTIVKAGLNPAELNAALRKISNVVTEVYKFAAGNWREIPRTVARLVADRARHQAFERSTPKSTRRSEEQATEHSCGTGKERLRELGQSSNVGPK